MELYTTQDILDAAEGQGVDLDDYTLEESQDLFTTSGGFFSSKRCVYSTADNHTGGMPPLREGQEYLFFLEPKVYPEGLESPTGPATYVQADHPYAQIPTDAADHPERCPAIDQDHLEIVEQDWGFEYVMPQMAFGEACDYDVIVWDEATAEVYRMTCKETRTRVLGTQGHPLLGRALSSGPRSIARWGPARSPRAR